MAGRGDDPVSVFHRVRQIVPAEQDLVTIPVDCPVLDALELMNKHSVQQLPVVADEEVLGVFSYRHFSLRISAEPRLLKRGIAALVVEDFVEEVPLARPTDSLESVVRALQGNGIVLVGNPDALLAILTEADLVGYLHRIAQPYLLIQEIELGIRTLIDFSLTGEELPRMINVALSRKYDTQPGRMPSTLDRLTFDDQVTVIVDGRNFPFFNGAFGLHVDAVALQLRPIGDLRNAIFHFRRLLTHEETQLLIETRNWVLRRCRKVANKAVGVNND